MLMSSAECAVVCVGLCSVWFHYAKDVTNSVCMCLLSCRCQQPRCAPHAHAFLAGDVQPRAMAAGGRLPELPGWQGAQQPGHWL